MADKKTTTKKPANNAKNLVPLNERPKSVQREIQQKGVEASKKARAERKTLKDTLLLLLEQKIKGTNTTYNEEISTALVTEAMNGNVKAFVAIRDTIGEKPVENTNLVIETSESQQQVAELLNKFKE